MLAGIAAKNIPTQSTLRGWEAPGDGQRHGREGDRDHEGRHLGQDLEAEQEARADDVLVLEQADRVHPSTSPCSCTGAPTSVSPQAAVAETASSTPVRRCRAKTKIVTHTGKKTAGSRV